MSGNAEVDTLLALITQSATAVVMEYQKYGQDVPSLSSAAEHPIDSASDVLQLRKALRLLEGACNHLCDMLEAPVTSVVKRTIRFEPVLMGVAVEAKVADTLEQHPDGLHISKIAEVTNVPAHKLSKVLRVLATRNCFLEVDTDTYANNRISYALRSSSTTKAHDYTLVNQSGHLATTQYWEYLQNPDFGPYDTVNKSAWTYARRVIGGGTYPEQDNFFGWYAQQVRPVTPAVSPQLHDP
ncbi:hypothetical protein CONPUDRAFT_128543 [Coniophora puteana RWD-64-598 SS2]|uniref:O-methyltransferase domain-containing protein n=1 Tax=Coniophora puteana (strain RWD-64-598) TaxID=741705 RepID=A0A5M3ME74_CONPW|nr:uncharacterized protein CONPUDRAFT_128543 [Coniophora puteana RWD-64-598 SS2]EIW77522.1 hypothetical protein CONPUDRAFT_128543 [Coniophora puteana RWD-64-598 SS2]